MWGQVVGFFHTPGRSSTNSGGESSEPWWWISSNPGKITSVWVETLVRRVDGIQVSNKQNVSCHLTDPARARILNPVSGGQCHFIYLTILRRFSWSSLAYMYTKVALNTIHSFIHSFIPTCKLKGLAQAKIIKKSVILFWPINMTIWCKHVHRLELQKFFIFSAETKFPYF